MIDKNVLLEKIIEDHGSMISSLCTRMIRDRSLAEDAAQEIWVEVVKSIDSFSNKSSLSTWIYSVAKRVIYRLINNEKTYSTTYLSNYFRNWEDGDVDFPDDRDEKVRFVKEQCDSCMVGILHCLDNKVRLAYIMRDIAELSYNDIASIFDKSEAAVRKDISRARNKLRMFLNDECYLYNSDGNCKCRMKEAIKDIDLSKEFKNVRNTVESIGMFLKAEDSFPRENFLKIS